MIKRFSILLVASLLTVSTAAAEDNSSRFTVSMSNTSEDINFNIASDLTGSLTPNVLSDLRWDNVEIRRLNANLDYRLGKRFAILIDLGVGAIVDGDATDRDFFGNERTDEFSRSTATVDGDSHVQAAIAFGWALRQDFSVPLWRVADGLKRVAFASDIEFIPVVGYGYSRHEISFVDGIQVIPDLGAIPGLNSGFDPTWSGTFLGFESTFRVGGRLSVDANVRFWPWAEFESEANWNLRSDLNKPISFVQAADGEGIELEIGLRWRVSNKQSISLSYFDNEFDTQSGSDKVITSQGDNLFTRLNQAEWLSHGWTLSYEWQF